MKKIFILLVANLVGLQISLSFSQPVETIVGTGVSASYPALGVGADGDGLGTFVNIYPGSGAICSDANNNIYFIDRHGKYIRKWNGTTHQVTTIAGNGDPFSPGGSYALINTGTLPGDGGLATNLGIDATSICVSKDGNFLYFSESGYETLRVINLITGIVNTVCGYNNGPIGGAVFCGSLVVKDNLIARFARVKTTSEHSLTLDDDNNLYVSDFISGRRLRKIFRNPATGIADGNSTIATLVYGSGTNAPTDGVSGYSQIPTSGANACSEPPGYGYIGTFSGGMDILYKNNYIYFTEIGSSGGEITLIFRKINLTTLTISTIRTVVASSGIPSVNISGLAIDNLDNLYSTDLYNRSIYKCTQAGVFSTFYQSNFTAINCSGPFVAGRDLSNACAGFSNGSGITNDYNGNLIYVDAGYYTINKILLCPLATAIITGINSVCVGGSISLTSSIAGGVWSSIVGRATVNALGTVTGTSAGVAQIRYTLPGIPTPGCRNYTSYNVIVNPIPPVPSIVYAPGSIDPQRGAGGGSNFCNARTFSLAGIPAGGIWNSSNIAVFTIDAAGVAHTVGLGTATLTYTISVTGCVNSRRITGTVVNCVGAKGTNSPETSGEPTDFDFQLYPNPATNAIHFNIKAINKGSGIIKITDLCGRQVKTQPLILGTNTMELNNLTKGIYFVSVEIYGRIKTQKLIIE